MKISSLLIITFLIFISCQDKQEQEELKTFQYIEITEAENIEVVREFYRLLDKLELDSLQGLLTTNNEIYYQTVKEPANFEGMRPFVEMFYSSFPDYKHDIESIFATGDKVTVRIRYTGTHTNSFMELEPTGNKFEYAGIFVFQLDKGKILKVWGVEDELSMMRQLGMELQMKEAS